MQRSISAVALILAAAACARAQDRPSPAGGASMPAPQFPGGASGPRAADPRAMEIADRVMTSLGGREAWDRTHFLRFGFGQERDGKFQGRTHYWDKWTGRYRVEGTNREGQPFVILMNLNSK